MAMAIDQQAQAIIDRLAAVSYSSPVLDRARAERALAVHLAALDLPPMPVRWVIDAEAGYLHVYRAAWRAAKRAAERAAENAAWHAAWRVGERAADRVAESAAWRRAWSAAWRALERGAWSAAERAAENAAWRAAENAAKRAAENAAKRAAENAAKRAATRGAESAAGHAIERAASSAASSAAWRAAERAAWSAAWRAAERAAWSAAWRAAERAADRAAESAAWNAAWRAAESAAGRAIESAATRGARRVAIDHYRGIWLPFVDATEAGLWMFFMMHDEIVAVPRPVLRLDGERLHCSDGPAVQWPGGAEYFFWRGVHVPRDIIQQPDRITVPRIDGEVNVEVKRVLIERYGVDRFLVDGGAVIRQRDDIGILYERPVENDEPIVMVKVKNSTPEPAGHFKDYFIRVPPAVRTARDAVAWSFGVTKADYKPEVET